MKEKDCQLENIFQGYREVFQYLKGMPPKKEVEHEIEILPTSPLPNIGLHE
jgi:hypothetical protein